MEKIIFLAVVSLACLQGTRGTAPTITGGTTQTANIAENSAVATSVLGLTADIASTWTKGGTDAASFTLSTTASSTTTELRAAASFNAEGTSSYTVTVTAADASTPADTTVVTITVTVTNVNEAPTFASSYSALVATGATSTTTIVTAAATDPESNTITYAVGSDFTSTFDISSAGVITVKSGVTLSTAGAYYFIDVTASDGQSPALTGTTYVSVCVGTTPCKDSGAAILTGAMAALMLALMAHLA